MNKNFIHAEAEMLLDVIGEQFSQIRSYNGIVPRIELDIMLANIAKLYEQLTLLKRPNLTETVIPEAPLVERIRPLVVEKSVVNLPTGEQEKPLVTVVKEKAPIVSFVVRPSFVAEPADPAPTLANQVSDKNLASKMDTTDNAKPNLSIPASVERKPVNEQEEPHSDSKSIVDPVVLKSPVVIQSDQAALVSTIPEKGPISEQGIRNKEEPQQAPVSSRKGTIQTMGLFDSVVTVADQYELQPTLHDKISKNKTDSSLGKKLQNKPVEDLKKSIGINEKFAFINELFDGDLSSYNKAIDKINQCSSIEDARKIIMEELMPSYNWNQEGKSYLNLNELIERRFSRW